MYGPCRTSGLRPPMRRPSIKRIVFPSTLMKCPPEGDDQPPERRGLRPPGPPGATPPASFASLRAAPPILRTGCKSGLQNQGMQIELPFFFLHGCVSGHLFRVLWV